MMKKEKARRAVYTAFWAYSIPKGSYTLLLIHLFRSRHSLSCRNQSSSALTSKNKEDFFTYCCIIVNGIVLLLLQCLQNTWNGYFGKDG